jgi:hypothetical protein
MMGPGEPPVKASNDRATQAAVGPADTKVPQKALTPEPPPQPDPQPEPPPPDPSAGDVAPPDPSADDEPELEEPAKAIVRTPKPVTPKPTPIDKAKPKPELPKGDPVALLEDARKASMANNATQAYDLARKSYDIDRNSAALKLMGLSACKMGDSTKAKAAYKKLDAALQKQLQSVCQEKGIQLEP